MEMTRGEIEHFLATSMIGRIGLSLDDKPYVVPLSYILLDNKIYFHCRKGQGKKIMYMNKNPHICFETDTYTDMVNFSHYKSVIVFGKVREVTDADTKMLIFQKLAEKYRYAGNAGITRNYRPIANGVVSLEQREFMLSEAAVYVIDLEESEVSGRKK